MARLGTSIGLTSLVILLASPAPAEACGGFFCNRPRAVPDAFGNPPPVQAGEQIAYGIESDGSLQMSVRIFYQGAAPEFAWILPVPVLPTLSLGTDQLFAALDTPTQPYFRVHERSVVGQCIPNPYCGVGPDAGVAYRDAGASDAAAASDGSAGLTVELMSTLGPFETVVLAGGTGADVQAWLTSHHYVIPAESIPLLDAYASTGHHFVALRLRGDATVDQIQPITLTMPATSPCLPIRLTSFATQPDLPIIAFFLGDARAVSSNYSMLDPTWDDIGLWRGGTSYSSYVTRAVRAAGGHAFVTDYAGPTPTFSTPELASVLDLASETSPSRFLQQLNVRGYLHDPHILAILSQYLVPPAGMMSRAYYNCLVFGPPFSFVDSGVGGCGTPTSYDPMAAANAIDLAVTQPLVAAHALLARHPFTTRLYTTMSAPDMTIDPEFRLDPALGAVPRQRGAVLVIECEYGHYDDEAGGYYSTDRGATLAFAPTPHATAQSWCLSHGRGWSGGHDVVPSIDGGRYPDGAPRPPAVFAAGGGSGCAVGGSGSAGVWAIALVLAAVARRPRVRSAAARTARCARADASHLRT